MIRTFLILIVAIAIGQLLNLLNNDMGFYLTIVLFILAEFGPRIIMKKNEEMFRECIQNWMQKNNFTNADLEYRYFRKGKIKNKTSDVQVVYLINSPSLESSGVNYWAVCGSWLLGLFVKKVTIYKSAEDKAAIDIVTKIEMP